MVFGNKGVGGLKTILPLFLFLGDEVVAEMNEGLQGIDNKELAEFPTIQYLGDVEKKICFACKREVDVIEGHHLSYEPEIVAPLCKLCHYVLHTMARINRRENGIARLFQIIDWIEKYSDQWINGRQKYRVSEYHKSKQRERYNSPQGKERIRAYQQSEQCHQRRQAYRGSNVELIKEQRRNFYHKHRERLLKERRTDEYREKKREQRQKNAEHYRQHQVDWRMKNPEKVREYQNVVNKKRALIPKKPRPPMTRSMKGENHPGHKLTEMQIFEIQNLLKNSVTQQEIASKFGVTRSTIGSIAQGKSWSYLNA